MEEILEALRSERDKMIVESKLKDGYDKPDANTAWWSGRLNGICLAIDLVKKKLLNSN